VVTTPPGAQVTLDGEADLQGITPITFTYPAIGEYKLKITKRGYEDYESKVLLDPSKPQQVAVELSPKTVAKAALRSAIFPGWGQRYTERKGKGFLFTTLFAGASLALVATHMEFQDRRDEYYARLSDYDNAVAGGASIADLSFYHANLARAQGLAYDAESDRRIAAMVTIGVWGLNVIDALVSSPGERVNFSIKGLTLAPSSGDGVLGVTLSRAF
jgi:hypothetical protein